MNDKQVEGKGARSGGGVRGEGGGGYLTTRELSVVRDARATPLALEGGARSGNDHGVRISVCAIGSRLVRRGGAAISSFVRLQGSFWLLSWWLVRYVRASHAEGGSRSIGGSSFILLVG